MLDWGCRRSSICPTTGLGGQASADMCQLLEWVSYSGLNWLGSHPFVSYRVYYISSLMKKIFLHKLAYDAAAARKKQTNWGPCSIVIISCLSQVVMVFLILVIIIVAFKNIPCISIHNDYFFIQDRKQRQHSQQLSILEL